MAARCPGATWPRWWAGSSHAFKVIVAAGSTRNPVSLQPPARGGCCCPVVPGKQVGDGQGSAWGQHSSLQPQPCAGEVGVTTAIIGV